MDKKIVAKKSEKIKFEEGLNSRKKKDALEFIRSLTIKQIGEVLGEGDVMYNDYLDAFFVWRSSKLVMYINESAAPKLPPGPQYVEKYHGADPVCERCGEAIQEIGFIKLEDSRTFHYNPKCWPTKASAKSKE